jgi:hypothetical protein
MPILEQQSSSPETILKPYLDATLSLTVTSPDSLTEPLFSTYYIQKLPPASSSKPSSPLLSDLPSTVLITPPPSTLLPESSDSAATNAEAVFHEAIRTLKSIQETLESVNLDEGEDEPFWPLIEGNPDEEAEEW